MTLPGDMRASSFDGKHAHDDEFNHTWMEIGKKVFDAAYDIDLKLISKDVPYKTLNVNKKTSKSTVSWKKLRSF